MICYFIKKIELWYKVCNKMRKKNLGKIIKRIREKEKEDGKN